MQDRKNQIDWMITIIPFVTILFLFCTFVLAPKESNAILTKVRFFLGDTMRV